MPSLEFASIDDFLGPRDGRFLGEGFKRVDHSLTDLTISPGAQGAAGIEATAHLAVPGAWSRKGGQQQKPHLSSIDVMIFAAQLTGLYAAHTCALGPDALFEVRSVDMKAGPSPDEEGLDEFPVSGRLAAAETGGGSWSTTLECRVGSLSARLHAVHSAGRPPTGTRRAYHLAQELPGPWNDQPYGVPHSARRQLLTGVNVTGDGADGLQASARVALVPDGAEAARDHTQATMIDAFVAAMQLGQVLLYTLDGVDREGSNNLWMRRTRVTAGAGAPARGDDEVTARLGQARVLPSDSGTWRSAELSGTLHGVQARASVVHLLNPSPHSGSQGGEGR
ncbi:AvrD family protein [Streptomyces fructofermentans]|uniref:AvrD family protein n=1 Tax=Streptomyces fructofermentans TaxID=152141 RepID=UPI0033CC04CD